VQIRENHITATVGKLTNVIPLHFFFSLNTFYLILNLAKFINIAFPFGMMLFALVIFFFCKWIFITTSKKSIHLPLLLFSSISTLMPVTIALSAIAFWYNIVISRKNDAEVSISTKYTTHSNYITGTLFTTVCVNGELCGVFTRWQHRETGPKLLCASRTPGLFSLVLLFGLLKCQFICCDIYS